MKVMKYLFCSGVNLQSHFLKNERNEQKAHISLLGVPKIMCPGGIDDTDFLRGKKKQKQKKNKREKWKSNNKSKVPTKLQGIPKTICIGELVEEDKKTLTFLNNCLWNHGYIIIFVLFSNTCHILL